MTKESFAIIDELLQRAASAGAFCMGMVCAAASESGREPSLALLSSAARCKSLEEAMDAFEQWAALQGRPFAGNPKDA
jgi:hypothetical protein